MLEKTRLILLYATICSAQVGGPAGAPAPLPSPPPRPPATTTDNVSHFLTECVPGDLLPGPTCTSFLMCVGWLTFATRRVRFECGPGTVFSAKLSTCVHGDGTQCLTDGTPATLIPTPSPPGSVATTPPSSCPSYQLDPTSIFECLEPGYFPSLADCVRFYKCIVTMDCIIKGFLFRCPSGYLFDRKTKRCLKEELLGRCDRVADASAQNFQIKPVVEIQPESFDDFFQADKYWDFMPFLPNETQKIVAINPLTQPLQPFFFARESLRSPLHDPELEIVPSKKFLPLGI